MHFGIFEDVVELQRVLVRVLGGWVVTVGAVPVVIGDRHRAVIEPSWEIEIKKKSSY